MIVELLRCYISLFKFLMMLKRGEDCFDGYSSFREHCTGLLEDAVNRAERCQVTNHERDEAFLPSLSGWMRLYCLVTTGLQCSGVINSYSANIFKLQTVEKLFLTSGPIKREVASGSSGLSLLFTKWFSRDVQCR